MSRDGIDRFQIAKGEDEYDLLGAKTLFRVVTSKMVENVVKEGKWFSFCTRISKEQVDIMSEKNKNGEKIGLFASDIYPETVYRSAIYKYLWRDYLCYYECPTITRDTALDYGYKSAYNKYLVTSNVEVVARWLGIDAEEATMLYGSRLEEACEDNECDMFPYLKLYETREGVRKVTKPRKDLDLGLAGTRVVPVYALEKGIEILYNTACSDYYNIDFVKDGGQERTINTTFSTSKLRDVYGDTDFFRRGVEGMYNGNFLDNPAFERGYIRVFEVGSSKYDEPLRAVNYARIIKFYKSEPDLAYINVDICSAMEVFKECIKDVRIPVDEVVEMLNIFSVGTERKVNDKDIKTTQDLENWVDAQEILLSTVFLRQLAMFMIGNPQWFRGYTGTPIHEKTVFSTGDELDSFEEDFELDMM